MQEGVLGQTASGQILKQKSDLNLIGSRLSKITDELHEVVNLTRQAANTIFGSTPEEETRPDKDERPPTISNLVDNLERLIRQCRVQANRF